MGAYVYLSQDWSQGCKDCHFRNIKMYESSKENSLQGLTLPKIGKHQKFLQIKVVKDSVSYKKVSEYICLSPTGEELGAPKTDIFEILKCMKTAKQINFRTRCCQKYALYQKGLQIKVVRNTILYKKVRGCISPISPIQNPKPRRAENPKMEDVDQGISQSNSNTTAPHSSCTIKHKNGNIEIFWKLN